VTITDNGAGMDEARVKRAMHGGFSSKANGTGLGLSICRHLVSAHGGAFELKSKVGQGTVVRMVFPKIANATPPST
jgi:signal transduction histidine kinase